MRSPTELQRAHDMLTRLLLETNYPETADEVELTVVMWCANVLCWALNHDHNQKFAQLLGDIERDLADQGILLFDLGTPVKENLG